MTHRYIRLIAVTLAIMAFSAPIFLQRSDGMAEDLIGTVTHYFGKPQVGIVALTRDVTTGDRLRFLGHGADFQQTVTSMQVEHAAVETASAGTEVGVRVSQRVREGGPRCIESRP